MSLFFRIFTLLSILILGLVLSMNIATAETLSATLDQQLHQSWDYYKRVHMLRDELVWEGMSNSESQSYAMLKAYFMNDRQTFARVWRWTKQNMKRDNDELFYWLYTPNADGGFGKQDDYNAADGDQDIAYALLMAGESWGEREYLYEGARIAQDLWDKNVVRILNRYYLLPGDAPWFQNETAITVNPSYLAPYVYRKFAQYDLPHAKGWSQLARDIYPTLEACSNLSRMKLPVNFCDISKKTGRAQFSAREPEYSSQFSYDAFRVFWRMAMDKTPESRRYLQRHRALLTWFTRNGSIPEGFDQLGKPAFDRAPSGYAHSAAMAQSHVIEPQRDRQRYAKLIAPYWHEEGYWFSEHDVFQSSVIWFNLYPMLFQP